jgi:hypothetical protein
MSPSLHTFISTSLPSLSTAARAPSALRRANDCSSVKQALCIAWGPLASPVPAAAEDGIA